MDEKLIEFDTAKLAKEKEFAKDFTVGRHYDGVGQLWNGTYNKCELNKYLSPCCTQSLLQKWLREVHNIHVWCVPNNHPTIANGYVCFVNGAFVKDASYEDALEAGLQEGLKLIKHGQE